MPSPAAAIQLHRTRSASLAEARRLQRLARSGDLVRIQAGVFADPELVAALDDHGRHVLRVRALLPRFPAGAMLSHWSALALLGWPHIGSWPDRVHLTDPGATADRHRDGYTVHRRLLGDVDERTHVFEGMSLLPAAAVAVELARSMSLSESVVVLDHLLRTAVVTADALDRRLAVTAPRGRTAAANAVACASGRRESVGESYTAARMIEIGVPRFVEQHEFRHADGTVDRVDFWLPELGIVVEFDGRQKYEDPSMRGGRSGPDVLWDEKRREDRIRARTEVRGFIRVRWWHLVDPDRLRALFREHGVPLGSGQARELCVRP